MTSPLNESTNSAVKEKIEIGKNLFSLLRDASLFSLFILLLIAPTILNERLIKAGFEEGTVAGFKWKKQLSKTDNDLVQAAQQIDALNKRVNESNKIIAALEQSESGSQTVNAADAQKQIKKNEVSSTTADTVNSRIQTTLENNTPILNPEIDTSKTSSLVNIVNTYKIAIYYNQEKSEQKEEAFEIKKSLEQAGVKSSIQVKPQKDSASSNQIRYFNDTEREVAYALQNILGESYTKEIFNLQTVYTPSPNFISIFLAS
ncbi:hypothetical protein C1752_17114 [Acaryochloris thomasi RCC1774]|uniref:Uncharacterized protein n=1 Tax=Acaryochloris thomasi RCC1774 TaxID=1764569 RepID=A0A2W1JEL4_9CYAN|nr:hypothetical protein [Acaryochloris thomasi]PZD70185.1 hypothetical protein C1752_17114 [Acaryochloris thomasi RCC1774]